MKTFSVYVIVAALALMEVNAVALPSDESDFHMVQDTELGPVYSNAPPKERRGDTTWYPVGGDGGNPVYSNVEPSHVSKRDRHHGGPPQSGPGGHGKGPGWFGGNHHHDTNPDTNPSANTTGTASTAATDTENTKRDQHHGGPPQSGHGGHGNRPGWVDGNHHHDTNPDATNPNTDPSATTTGTAPTGATDTENTKRDDAYKPAPVSYVEDWVKKHPTEKRDLVERGTIEKRTYAQCVACVAACHLLQAGIYTLSISQQVHFCLGYCATLGSCTPYFQAKYQDQYGPHFPT